jgi:hypothetical protein
VLEHLQRRRQKESQKKKKNVLLAIISSFSGSNGIAISRAKIPKCYFYTSLKKAKSMEEVQIPIGQRLFHLQLPFASPFKNETTSLQTSKPAMSFESII